MSKQTYSSSDIRALSDRDHVRLRTQIYLGNTKPATFSVPVLGENSLRIEQVTFIPAAYRAIGEILDNSVDELIQLSTTKQKVLTFNADPTTGTYTIADNGRGIPITMHELGVHTPEVALSQLRAGRNFSSDKDVGVIGQNGVGAACTNYCSSSFEVTINRDKQQYFQKFTDGASVKTAPDIKPHTSKSTGTSVKFTLDPTVFSDVAIPPILIRNRAYELAMTNKDIKIVSNGVEYQCKGGISEVMDKIVGDKEKFVFHVSSNDVEGEFYVVLNAHDSQEEMMFTWVNSSFLFDGGICNTQFLNSLVESVQSQLEKTAKRAKVEITKNDVRAGLLILGSLKVRDPQYDSQAKTRLTSPSLKKEYTGSINAQWKNFAKSSAKWIDSVFESASKRHNKQKDLEATKDFVKSMRKRVPGLLDATNKDRQKCMLLVTEGLSAQSQICEVRDPSTIGAMALTGKVNNVHGSTAAQVLAMSKVTPLLSAIGLIPGKKATRADLHYGKLIISTDADYDGDDIFTLLVNLLYQFWPNLFDPAEAPFVYRLTSPNVCAVKGDQRVHYTTRTDYERNKNKHKGWSVQYYKGLGSMETPDWRMLLTNIESSLLPIQDVDGSMQATLQLLFGDDADARKAWLSGNSHASTSTKTATSFRSSATGRVTRQPRAIKSS